MSTIRADSVGPPVRHPHRSVAVRARPAEFERVYREHHQAIYRYCKAILRHEEDAHDALQSTMTRAYAALQSEERDFELRPWLFRIAHNESISLLRQRRPTAELAAADAMAGESLERRVGERSDLAELQADLADLPERQRSALVMRELSGLPHEEIATALEISPGAAKQSIFEARTALHQCREGRDMACEEIRRAISDADGRVLRGRRVRAHLRSCPGCRDFSSALRGRPQQLSALAPPLPAAAGVAVLAHIIPGAKLAGLGAGAAATGGAGSAVAVKAAIAVAIVAGTAGGVTAVSRNEAPPRPAVPATAPATVGTPAAGGAAGSSSAAPGSARAGHGARAPHRTSKAAHDSAPAPAGGSPATGAAPTSSTPAGGSSSQRGTNPGATRRTTNGAQRRAARAHRRGASTTRGAKPVKPGRVEHKPATRHKASPKATTPAAKSPSRTPPAVKSPAPSAPANDAGTASPAADSGHSAGSPTSS